MPIHIYMNYKHQWIHFVVDDFGNLIQINSNTWQYMHWSYNSTWLSEI